jgi:tRNA A22 N-methylase
MPNEEEALRKLAERDRNTIAGMAGLLIREGLERRGLVVPWPREDNAK